MDSTQELSKDLDSKVKKYLRGDGANLEVLKDKKLRGQLSVREQLYGKSAKTAAKTEKWLLPSAGGYLEGEGIEKTWRLKQENILPEIDISSAKNLHDIKLPDFGPYTLDFTPSGRYMVLAGSKGHLGVLDMNNMRLTKEMQVREKVRDVVFLHNELFFATAQKKYPFIYNRDGVEIHCLKEHGAVSRLQFLENHFLLASINNLGELRYQDVTMGEMVGNIQTHSGRTDVMQVNPFNGVVALGTRGGTVSMWKPTSQAPLVRIQSHVGPILAMAFHPNGHLMATSGKEKKIKIWDLRTFKTLQTLPGRAISLDFSQKGLLATGTGSFVQILRDSSESQGYSRYMHHSMAKGYQIGKLLFRPYEDALGIGHSMGWSSIVTPGSGEPNFDTWLANPFETSKQRGEKEIRSLLDKLPPETIMLDPSKIGTVRAAKKKRKATKQEIEAEVEAAVEDVKGRRLKNKTKGRSKASNKLKKRNELIHKAKTRFFDQSEENSAKRRQKVSEDSASLPVALQRFTGNKPSA
ncbi:probable U3 small nucleolar RNA-associated protein 7 [Mercurialis annua]|uniref:probable U3 small nucleolar RNA-associated protein 7 n=1 Tax=Mercurialis annua TaxID=3986 RepID=UPI00215EBE45|nr:probable U3 small nucleolar RNA-associated protein 7 [Mercurialis annua]